MVLLCRFSFDHEKPLPYILLTVFFWITTTVYLNPILSIDTLFLGSCYHIAAFFKDLQGVAISLEYFKLYRNGEGGMKMFLWGFSSFVDQHNRLLKLVHKMEDVFGEIFVIQYIGSMFSICSQAYISTLVSDPQ